MKKLKIWSIMMLMVMALPLVIACGGDDNDTQTGGKTNQTTDVAISSNVSKLGITYAYIDGFVNLNMITASYSNQIIGIEYSTKEDFSSKRNETTKNIVGNKISVPIYSLNGNTKYYYRTFVTVNNLNYYGETLSFTTKDFENVISSCEVYNIGADTAVIKYSGNASSIDEEENIRACIAYSSDKASIDGNSTVLNCPIEWLINNKVTEITISNLQPETTYYFCARTYAGSTLKNGEEKSFTTLPPPVIIDDHSGSINSNTTGPLEAQTRYEFPKVKGGTSEVIVHSCILNSNTGETGVNYGLEWDHQKRATRWVCYQMYASVCATNWNRNNWPNGDPWAYDPLVPEAEQQNTYNELSKTNPPLPNSTYYQKGHILPSADRLGSQDANGQTYYMTNIYPQVGDFNSGIWLTMEGRIRTWANQSDTLYVCKGGTIDDSKNILGYTMAEYGGHTGNHIVPKYFFMAALSKKGGKVKALGFWAEHKDGTSWGALKDYIVSVDRLEELTGLDFFCNLPDDTENAVEANLTLSDWNLQ